LTIRSIMRSSTFDLAVFITQAGPVRGNRSRSQMRRFRMDSVVTKQNGLLLFIVHGFLVLAFRAAKLHHVNRGMATGREVNRLGQSAWLVIGIRGLLATQGASANPLYGGRDHFGKVSATMATVKRFRHVESPHP
jgi:hypothetical protein